MKVKDAIIALQKLDAELDLLVDTQDGGLPFAVGSIKNGTYEEPEAPEVKVAIITVLN